MKSGGMRKQREPASFLIIEKFNPELYEALLNK